MTKTVEMLSDLAERLAPDQQQVLLDIATSLAQRGRFYDTLSPEQQAALDDAIAEADRSGGLLRCEVDVRLDALFSRHGA